MSNSIPYTYVRRPVNVVLAPLYARDSRAENHKISRWSVKENMVTGALCPIYLSIRFHAKDNCYNL